MKRNMKIKNQFLKFSDRILFCFLDATSEIKTIMKEKT